MKRHLLAFAAPEFGVQADQMQPGVAADQGGEFLAPIRSDTAGAGQLHSFIVGEVGDGEGQGGIHASRHGFGGPPRRIMT